MKKIQIIIWAMIFCFIVSASPTYAAEPGALRVKYMRGSALVKAENTHEWISILMNMPLMEGDEIYVPQSGRMEIQIRDGSFLRVDEGSSLVIHSVYGNDYRLSLTHGRMYVHFQGIPGSSMRIETPGSFVRTSREATFSVDMYDTAPLELSVFRGTVYAAGSSEMIRVRAGETLTLEENYYADITLLKPSDEWELWNRNRDDQREERVYSARYLPDDLKVYSSDLDDHGEWIYVRKHGYVWKPYVIGVSEWSPYRAGRWAWFDNDYVWVSYEPWGWAPYHYGRWAFTVSTGWFWVPPARGMVYWSPGYVGWIRTPSYVAWVPLAPGDIYYAYGYYGPGSVNIINININIHNKLRKKMYRNVTVDRAVIAVHRDSFTSGKYKKYRTRENPFIRFVRPDRDGQPNDLSFLPFTRETRPDPRLHIDAEKYRTRRADPVDASLKKTRGAQRRDREIIPFTRETRPDPRLHIDAEKYRTRRADPVDASLKKTRVVQRQDKEIIRITEKKREKIVQKKSIPQYADREFRQKRQPVTRPMLQKERTTERYNNREKKYYRTKTDDQQRAFRFSQSPTVRKSNVLMDGRTQSFSKAQQNERVEKQPRRQGKGSTAFSFSRNN